MEEIMAKLEASEEAITAGNVNREPQENMNLLTTDKNYEIAKYIEEGTYTISLGNGRSPMWKILRKIMQENNTIIEGYLWCIKCQKVLPDCAKVFSDHKCCKELKDSLANKAVIDDRKVCSSRTHRNSTQKYANDQQEIAEKIEEGTYSLTIVTGKSIVWKIIRKIVREDNSVVEGYAWCIQCRKVIRDYSSSLCRHKCCMELKDESDSHNTESLAPKTNKNYMDRIEIAKKIEGDFYTLTSIKGNCVARQILRRILKEDAELLKGYIFCIKCRKVFSDIASQTNQHRCYTDIKFSIGNKIIEEDEVNANITEKNDYRLEDPLKLVQQILENVEKGIYSLKEYDGKSALSKILKRIRKEDKTIMEDVVYCMQCYKVCIKSRVHNHQCCKQLKQTTISSDIAVNNEGDIDNTSGSNEICEDIANKIEEGIYILTQHRENDYIWKILRNIVAEDDTPIEGYKFCIKCNRVFSIDHKETLYNHKCCIVFKESLLKENLQYEEIAEEEEGNSSKDLGANESALSIATKIERGIYTLIKSKRRSYLNQIMQVILKDDKTICKGYMYCTQCRNVLPSNFRTYLYQHKCYKEFKGDPVNSKAEDIPNTSRHCTQADLIPEETLDEEELSIDKNISSGSYRLSGKHYGLSEIWNITSEIQKDDGSLLESYISCSKCCKVLKFLGYQSLDLYRHHKCIRDHINDLNREDMNSQITVPTGSTFIITEIEESKDNSLSEISPCKKTKKRTEFNTKIEDNSLKIEKEDMASTSSQEILETKEEMLPTTMHITEIALSKQISDEKLIKQESPDILKENETIVYNNRQDDDGDEFEAQNEPITIDDNKSKWDAWKITKSKISANIEKGLYTLTKDNRRSHVWKILRHIVMEDGTIYKGYVHCIQCLKVFASNIPSSLYRHNCCKKLMEMRVKKKFKDLQLSQEICEADDQKAAEVAINPKKKYHINNEIAEKVKNGSYTLTPFNGKSYRWKIIRHIVKEDNSLLKDYIFCIQCENVYLAHTRKHLSQHKCFKELKQSFLKNIGDDEGFQTSKHSTSIATDESESGKERVIPISLENLITSGVYSLCDRKKGSNYIWNFMREIKKENGTYVEDYICCYKCNKVLRFFEDRPLDNYKFHKCSTTKDAEEVNVKRTIEKAHSAQPIGVDGSAGPFEEFDKDYITKQLANGVYSIARRMKGTSHIWRIIGEIQKDDGTYLSNFLCCRKCYYIFRHTPTSLSNLYRHKCSQEFKKSLDSSAVFENPSERANEHVDKSKKNDNEYDNLAWDSIKIEPVTLQENSMLHGIPLVPAKSLEASEEIMQPSKKANEDVDKSRNDNQYDNLAWDSIKIEPVTLQENSMIHGIPLVPAKSLEASEEIMQPQISKRINGQSNEDKEMDVPYTKKPKLV